MLHVIKVLCLLPLLCYGAQVFHYFHVATGSATEANIVRMTTDTLTGNDVMSMEFVFGYLSNPSLPKDQRDLLIWCPVAVKDKTDALALSFVNRWFASQRTCTSSGTVWNSLGGSITFKLYQGVFVNSKWATLLMKPYRSVLSRSSNA